MSWCGVRAGVWLAGGLGVRLGVGVSLGLCYSDLGVPLGLVGWVGVPGVLLGFRSLALVAVAVPLSSSGACEVALVEAGVVAWR